MRWVVVLLYYLSFVFLRDCVVVVGPCRNCMWRWSMSCVGY